MSSNATRPVAQDAAGIAGFHSIAEGGLRAGRATRVAGTAVPDAR